MPLRPGDILAFWGADWRSRLISLATLGPSHVAIVCRDIDRGLILVEATTMCPWVCLYAGRRLNGVQAHPIRQRVGTYPGRVERVALADGWELSDYESRSLTEYLQHHCGREYDLKGALVSGTRLIKWASCLPYPDAGSLFCSELVARALQRAGRFPLDNPQAYNPASLIRRLRRGGLYERPQPFDLSDIPEPTFREE